MSPLAVTCIVSQHSSRGTWGPGQESSAIKYERRSHKQVQLTSTGSETSGGGDMYLGATAVPTRTRRKAAQGGGLQGLRSGRRKPAEQRARAGGQNLKGGRCRGPLQVRGRPHSKAQMGSCEGAMVRLPALGPGPFRLFCPLAPQGAGRGLGEFRKRGATEGERQRGRGGREAVSATFYGSTPCPPSDGAWKPRFHARLSRCLPAFLRNVTLRLIKSPKSFGDYRREYSG